MKTDNTINEMLAENRRLIDALNKCRDAHMEQQQVVQALRKTMREEIDAYERELENQRTDLANASEDARRWRLCAQHLTKERDEEQEQNGNFRELAEKAISRLFATDKIWFRVELDKLKEGAK